MDWVPGSSAPASAPFARAGDPGTRDRCNRKNSGKRNGLQHGMSFPNSNAANEGPMLNNRFGTPPVPSALREAASLVAKTCVEWRAGEQGARPALT